MTQLLGFFKEGGGELSSTRLIFILGSIYAMGMGAWVFGITHDYMALIVTVPTLSSVFLGGKLIQKPMEKTNATGNNGE